MPIFIIKQNRLEKVKEVAFKNEKEIQRMTEANLGDIFGIDFVRNEFELHSLRIDTLAFDNETKSFVVIEFKRDKNFSVIDQGYAYLALLLNNKADFILEYNERMNKSLKREDVDWSQSKVIFISPQFTTYQKQAINFRDLPIELYEISKHENGLILYNQLKSPETNESINKVSRRSEVVKSVSKEIKVYTEDDHLSVMPDDIKELYNELKDRILNLGEVDIKPRKSYIGFKASTNFVDVLLQKSQIKLWLNMVKGELDDTKKMAREISNYGHWGYEITLKSNDEVDYLITLVRQSYNKNK